MKRLLIRSLVYALGVLVLVIYYSAAHARTIDLTVQDGGKDPINYSFCAIPLSTYSEATTVVRDGALCHYEFDSNVVYSLSGSFGVLINYSVSRNGTATGAGKMLLPISAADSGKLWTHLDDHLLACASLR